MLIRLIKLKAIIPLFIFILFTGITATASFAVSSISVSPGSHSFDTVNIGSTSQEQFITVSNNGTTPMNVSSIDIIGSDSSDFYLNPDRGANPCSSTTPVIQAGGSCTVSVVMAPGMSGQKNAFVRIESDDPDNPVVHCPLSGDGVSYVEFNDVPESHWAENYIHTLFYNSITMGCGGGNFCPTQTVTREQMAVFIIRAIYGDDFTDYDPNPYFSDVPSNHWAFKYIQKMSEEGITTGCGGGNYCPAQTVTRDQMAVFLTRAFLVFIDNIEMHTLTVIKSGTGSGTVTSAPSGISCGADCSEVYEDGMLVTLSPNPDADSTVTWSGGGCSGSQNCVVTMGSDITVTATYTEDGPPGSINYQEIPMVWDDNQYEGSFRGESIGPSRSQRFYKFTRPAGCTSQVQVWLAGSITTESNVNMVVSDSDFVTESDALSLYLQFLGNPPVYEQYNTVTIAGKTYWYWFSGSYESEFVYFFNPVAPKYYIQLVNEENFTGIYRIEAFCS
jgi:hypothetical protein